MSEEPRRWLDDPALDAALRAALEAGRAEAPSEAELASLAGRLGPLLGGPGGGGGGDGGGGGVDPSPLLGGSVATKTIGALVVAAAIAGTSAWMATRPDPAPPPATTRVAPPEIEPPALRRELPVGVDVPEEIAAPAPPVAPRARPPAPALEVDPAAELALIQRAQDALRTSSAEALARTEEHRRRFGDGTLGQEREVVAIDALARLGRLDEARARAARFHARWPRSAHGRRVDVIVGE